MGILAELNIAVDDPALVRYLRDVPEGERVAMLIEQLDLVSRAGSGLRSWLRMANRVLEMRASYEKLFVAGLRIANASTIRLWMYVCVNRIGVKRLLRLLRRERLLGNDRAEIADYWLEYFCCTDSERVLVAQFRTEFERSL
jgi:NADPH-dependent ferric siderophore reductase